MKRKAMDIIWIDSTPSTNSYIRERYISGAAGGLIPPLTMVCARRQTAGRGQRGNSWESEPGMNLTFSFHFKPEGMSPAGQFAISEAVALAMVDSLSHFGIRACIKWPNDIYVEACDAGLASPATGRDLKIAGILIENSILGDCIERTIAGIGLNVNQKRFLSDAPNPVSMAQIIGKGFDLQAVAQCVGACMSTRLDGLKGHHPEYMASLWRADGRLHSFAESSGTKGMHGTPFLASIEDVESSGHLILKRSDGISRRYAFKEVVFI